MDRNLGHDPPVGGVSTASLVQYGPGEVHGWCYLNPVQGKRFADKSAIFLHCISGGALAWSGSELLSMHVPVHDMTGYTTGERGGKESSHGREAVLWSWSAFGQDDE